MQTLIRDFFTQLKHDDFQGICSDEDHQLTVFSTDNSIYERRPQAVIFPKNSNDVCIVLKNLAQDKFQNLKLTARGGGTGTNGQSLTDGIVLDLSRFMNKILDVAPGAASCAPSSGGGRERTRPRRVGSPERP